MTAPEGPGIRIGGDDLVALREIVVVALLAPAADAATGAIGEMGGPADEVRRATALLTAIGWPGEPPSPVEITATQGALARTAVLIALRGAAEKTWECADESLEDSEPFDGREAIVDVVRAGRLLTILCGEDPAALPAAAPADAAVLEAFPDGLVIVAPTGAVEWSNQRARQLLGEGALAMMDSPARYERWLAERMSDLIAALDHEPGAGGEHTVALDGPDGVGLALAVRTTGLPDGGRIVVLRPGVARRLVPRPPRDGEEAFRLLMDAAPAMVWTCDARGLVTYANAATCRMLGVPSSDLLGHAWTAVVHPEDLDGVRSGFRAALDEQRDFSIEFRVRRADGRDAWVIGRGTARLDAERGFLGYVGGLQDVSGRRSAEEALRTRDGDRSREPGTLIFACDRSAAMEFVGRDWLSFTGRDQDAERGHGWLTSVHPGDRSRVAQSVASAAAARLPLESVHRMLRHDGEYRWVHMVGRPRTTSDGEPAGLVGACEDVTARRYDARRDAAVRRLVDLIVDARPMPELATALAEEAGGLLGAARVQVVMFRSDDAHVLLGAWTRRDAAVDDATLGAPSAEWSALVQVRGPGSARPADDATRSWGAIRVVRAGLHDPSPEERSLLMAMAEILGLGVAAEETADRFETAS